MARSKQVGFGITSEMSDERLAEAALESFNELVERSQQRQDEGSPVEGPLREAFVRLMQAFKVEQTYVFEFAAGDEVTRHEEKVLAPIQPGGRVVFTFDLSQCQFSGLPQQQPQRLELGLSAEAARLLRGDDRGKTVTFSDGRTATIKPDAG